jgi:2-iminobutanoate/2-iminopropanoate deaminase
LSGTDDAGKPVEGGVQPQLRRALDRLQAALESAGSSLAQTVAVHVYMKSAADFDAMNAAYREIFTDKPPTRTTIVGALPDGVLVMIAATAVANGIEREVMLPAGWKASPRPYSYIVRANGLVFFSGLVNRRGATDEVVTGPVGTQMKTILDNAAVLLKTAGLGFEDVVSSRVFLTDDSSFEEMNNEYRTRFARNPPARANRDRRADGAGNVCGIDDDCVDDRQDDSRAADFAEPAAVDRSALGPVPRFFPASWATLTRRRTTSRRRRRKCWRGSAGRSRTPALVPPTWSRNLIYLPDLWQTKPMSAVTRPFFPAEPPAGALVGAKLAARAGVVEMMMTAYK